MHASSSLVSAYSPVIHLALNTGMQTVAAMEERVSRHSLFV